MAFQVLLKQTIRHRLIKVDLAFCLISIVSLHCVYKILISLMNISLFGSLFLMVLILFAHLCLFFTLTLSILICS